MATITGFKRKFDEFIKSMPDILANEVERSQDVILGLNEDQILYGRDAFGNLLKPGYTDDPYFNKFKNPGKAAERYKKYKEKLKHIHRERIYNIGVQLFPDKPEDTPNLLINGNWFMNFLFINVSESSYTLGSNGRVASDIEAKYEKVFGLAPASKVYYWNGFIRPAIIRGYESIMS
ncbi:MAG: hypothetical protein LBG15_03235 [Dysgonamonadaceae bacterium]|jgi:hypothetical protein|nr:hypothetical protein [Dysgonamonadaceae bacterium]